MILKKLSAAGLLVSCVLSTVGFLGLVQTANAAALTSTNVEPTSLEASVFTNATVSFTTTTSIPANGKIKVTFPAGYNVSGIGPVSCSTMDGTFVFQSSGQIVTITRNNNGTIQTAAAEQCTINNIITPSSAGVTGTYTIETTDGTNVSLDIDAAVAGDTITASTAGALTSTNVQPASLVASTTNTITITFTTANSIPANGKIKVTFPNGFNTGGVNSPACSTMDGTFSVSGGGNNITITRNNDGASQAAAAESCTIGNITNPGATGTTGTYAIQTLTSTNTVIDQDLAVAGDTITAPAAGPLTSTNVQPASLVQSTANTVTVTFTTTTTIPADGKIKVTFPAGFNVASVNSATCSTMDGGFSFNVGGQTVTINRNNAGTSQTSAAESCTIGNITNPAATGVTGTYTIQTTNQSNTVLDQDTNVPGDTITGVSAGALTSTNVEPASLVQSTSSTVTVTFTTATTIPADGKIQVTFPAGFNVSSVNSANCSTMDGGFNFNPSGQTVIITRNNTGTGQTSAAESCTIGNITNPAATGTTGTYTIQTTNASNTVLDQDTNVPGDTISASSAGALTSTNVQPASLVAGASSVVTVTFTTTTTIPANGKIKVTFPSGFQLGSAGPVTCSTMDGNVSFGAGGQTVTINRDGTGTGQTSAAESCTISNVTNPPVSGSTSTYTIQTTDGSDAVLDQDLAVASDTITAAALTSTNVEPASLTAGATSVVTVSFTNINTIQNNGKIQITFGSGFNVSGASGGTCSTMDGSFITSISGQTVTLTRAGGTNKAAGAETCTINNVINPQVSGTTGTYTISNTASNNSISDTDASVTADTITAAALTSTNVEPASLIGVSTTTVTMSFTTANPIPSDGKIKVTFPSGFNVASASGATCSTMDGSFATSVSSQMVIITRSGGTSEPAGAQTCTVGSIRNPSTSGATGTYTIATTNSADATIDTATAASDAITGQSSSGSSTPVTLTYDIEIIAPVADAEYSVSDTITIIWSTSNSTGNVGAINLDYSTDGGASYTTIVTGASNSGSYAWTAPNITSSTVTVRAKATDLVTTLATDTSNEFSITGTSTGTSSPTETPSSPTEDPGGSSNGVTIYPAGSMLHEASSATVYYIDATGARRPFLDPQTYFTYATSFDVLIEVSATELSAYTLGLPMLPKAGTVLVKVSSSNKVYALEDLDGITRLRWVASESVAQDLFGDAWAAYIIDIDPILWGHVTIGDEVNSPDDLEADLTRMFARDALNALK